ncbi:unnamed protein product [Closterium sp. NIES-54]
MRARFYIALVFDGQGDTFRLKSQLPCLSHPAPASGGSLNGNMASVSDLSSGVQVSSVSTFAGKRLSVAQSSSSTVKISAKCAAVSVKASSESTSSDDVSRREVLKAALVLGAAVPASSAGFLSFAPASSADELVAKDLSGKVVMADNWLATHKGGDRTLVQGLDVSYRLPAGHLYIKHLQVARFFYCFSLRFPSDMLSCVI